MASCSSSEQKAAAQGAAAQAALDAGQIGAARIAIQKAIAERDDIVDLHLLHGRIEAAAGSSGDAFGAYNDALALDSSNGEALLGVAHFGMDSGHAQESEEAADRILTLDPAQPDALLIKGIYNIVHFRGDAALANADAILSRNPTSENGTVLKARALSILGRPDEALDIMEKRRQGSGESQAITRTLLELYRYRNDGAAMLTQFDMLRRALPADRSIVLDEANTLYKLGDVARARTFLRSLILLPALDEENARLVTNLWGEYDPTPLDPADLSDFAAHAGKPARIAMAHLYLARGDAGRALQALGGDMADPDLLALKAQVAIAQGNTAWGLGTADRILQQDKTNCDALLARGQATLALRRYTDTVIAAQVANANCPLLTPAYVVLARAKAGTENYAGAEIAFRDGIAHNIQDSRLAGAYSAWLEGRRQGERALAISRRLTNAAPALVSGWQLYLDLCTRNPDAGCTADAQDGMARAKQRFAVDLPTDAAQRPGLFSRLDQDKAKEGDRFDAKAAARNAHTTAPDSEFKAP